MSRFINMALLMLFAYPSLAQTREGAKKTIHPSPIAKVINYMGLKCGLSDTIYESKQDTSGRIILYLGGRYPDHVMTIVIKRKGLAYNPQDYLGKWVYVSSRVELYEKKPSMPVNDSDTTYLRIFTAVK